MTARFRITVVLLAFVIGILAVAGLMLRPRGRVAAVQLADGRILQVEAVTYGTHHTAGRGSALFERFSPWLPAPLRRHFAPTQGKDEIRLTAPALVVWVNAIDPATSNHVDCQGIRVNFIDRQGDIFPEATSHWFGRAKFWRVGHIFHAFPRTEDELSLQITPWRTNRTSALTFANPHVVHPRPLPGKPLPQSHRDGPLELVLQDLTLRTNGHGKYWETAERFWDPVWELRQDGRPAAGWQAVEWTVSDASGNEGQHLGVHQPTLRFSATVFPEVTNAPASTRLLALPEISTPPSASNLTWTIALPGEPPGRVVLGLFPAGVHHFLDGVYYSNPPAAVRMGATRGGAPSGWVGRSQRISPVRVDHWNAHYTPRPVIYIGGMRRTGEERLGIRLVDQDGRSWAAKPEPGGTMQDVMPYLLDIPPGAKTVRAEIIRIKPVRATFDVSTAASRAQLSEKQ